MWNPFFAKLIAVFICFTLAPAFAAQADFLNLDRPAVFAEDDGGCDGGCPLPPDDGDDDSGEGNLVFAEDDGGCDGGCPLPPDDGDDDSGDDSLVSRGCGDGDDDDDDGCDDPDDDE